MKSRLELQERFAGLLLGTAVGDALGLPAEGLTRSCIERRWLGNWRHRFVFGHGMCSDDTEHTFFVAHGGARTASERRRGARQGESFEMNGKPYPVHGIMHSSIAYER